MNSSISIASCARLCELNISVSTGSKQDKDATAKVNEDNNAESNVARVTKNIFAGSEVLGEIVKFAARARQEHAKLSLPWNDSGQRLVPNSFIQEHMETMGELKEEFLSMVQVFKEELPELREKAEENMGELYNPMDYPSDEEIEYFIERKFQFNLEYPPVPEEGGFINGVLEDVKEELNDLFQQGLDNKIRTATTDTWNRLSRIVARISEQLTDRTDEEVAAMQKEADAKALDKFQRTGKGKDYGREVTKKKKISNDLLQSGLDICSALKAFNITQDPELEQRRKEFQAILEDYDVDDLKDKDNGEYYRGLMVEEVNKVKESVDQITSKFNF